MRRAATLLVVGLALVGAVSLGACHRASPREVAPLEYTEVVTGEAAKPGESLPLVIAIHGLGDEPELFLRTFALQMPARIRIVAPRAPSVNGQGTSWFPLPAGSLAGADFADGVSAAGERIAALIEKLTRETKPPSLPIVFGYSQGGILAYYIGAEHASLVSAVLPISGFLPPPLAPEGVPAPTFAYHGARDDRVPIEGARATVAAFRAAGGSADLREYPHLGHAVSMALVHDVQAKIAELLAPGAR